MGKSLEKCHIGMFDVSECEQVVDLATQYNQQANIRGIKWTEQSAEDLKE